MDNTGFEITEKEKKHLIRYLLSKEDILVKTELEMLKNNNIPGILPVSEIHDDGKDILLFNVTSKIPFSKRLAERFDAEQFYKLLVSICNIWNSLDEYMLNPKHFVMNQNYLFFDNEKAEIYFIVMPIENISKSSLDIRKLFIYILKNVRYTDSGLSDFPQNIYSYLNTHIRLDTKDFLEYIQNTYKSLKGILRPLQEIPNAPVHNIDAKAVIDVEEVKQNVQSRFITQNEKIQELESAVSTIQTINESQSFASEVPGSFSVPTPKGAFRTTPPRKAKREKKKREKAEKKPKKEKKVKEKTKEIVSKPVGINVPIPYAAESKVNKEKKDEKSKGGLFGSLGFGKKKKETHEENIIADVNVSLGEKKDVIQPIEGMNSVRMPMPVQLQTSKLSQGFAKQQIYSQVQHESSIQSQAQRNYMQFQSQYVSQAQSSQQQIKSQYVSSIPQESKSFDDEVTIVVSDRNVDFDSTVALDSGHIFTENPALRNKSTGEVIKITKSGFLVGRKRKIEKGNMSVHNERIPDASIDVQSISHEHALFVYYGDKWHIKDEDSLNGTFVNEKKLGKDEEIELNQGDIIRFASEEYEYLIIK